MRILSVTAQKPEKTGSGVYLSELMKGFEKAGCNQALVAGITSYDTPEIVPGAAFFPVYFESEALPFPVVGMSDEMPYKSLRYREMTEEMREAFLEEFHRVLNKAVEEFDPELIICHHLYFLTSKLKDWFPEISVAGICHGSDLRQFVKNDIWPENVREDVRRGIAKLDRIYALHKKMALQIYDCFCRKGEPFPPVEVLGSGYDGSRFFPRKRLVYAGKLSREKGVMSLLRALSLLPYDSKSLEVVLCGGVSDEREQQEIEKLKAQAPYEVVCPGFLEHDVLSEYFRSADLFILPSFSEGLPLVILEAMACGTRVICTDLPGIREWTDETLPGNDIIYITPPKMHHVDEAEGEELAAFERRIAEAVTEGLGDFENEGRPIGQLSFEKLALRVMADEQEGDR